MPDLRAVRPTGASAKILSVAEDKVLVVMHEVGGNFDGGCVNPEFALVTWGGVVGAQVGRPVSGPASAASLSSATIRHRISRSRRTGASNRDGHFIAMRAPISPNVGLLPDLVRTAAKSVDHVEPITCRSVTFPPRAAITQHIADPALSQLGAPRVMFVS